MEAIQQILDCPVCLETFKTPVVLGCYHTFCKSCVQELHKNKAIKCPVCRAEHTNIDNVDLLPKNFIACELIDRLKALKYNNQQTNLQYQYRCDSEDGKAGKKWCNHCNTLLCDECWTVAHSVGTLKQHTPLPASESERCVKPTKCVKNCTAHVQHILDYYCTTCSLPICNICLIDSHKEHEVISAMKYINQARDGLLEMCNVVLENKAELDSRIVQTNSEESALENRIHNLEQQLAQLKAKQERIREEQIKLVENANQVEAVHQMLTLTVYQYSTGFSLLDVDQMKKVAYEIQSLYKMLYGKLPLFSFNPESYISHDFSSKDVESELLMKMNNCTISSTECYSDGKYLLEIHSSLDEVHRWLLIGVQTKNTANTQYSHNELETYGLSIGLQSNMCNIWKAGKYTPRSDLQVHVECKIMVLLDCDNRQLSFTISEWQETIPLPKGPYYLHFNTQGVSFNVVSCMKLCSFVLPNTIEVEKSTVQYLKQIIVRLLETRSLSAALQISQ